MTRSLALGAYLALAGLSGRRGEAEPPRPEGPLLWVHGGGPQHLTAVATLADRLLPEGVSTLLTLPRRFELPPAPGRLVLRPAPFESGVAVRAFLEHWAPDVLLWVGGGLRPALLARTQAPKFLVEGAPEPGLLARGAGWPGLARAVVPLFDRALVRGDAGAERLSRAGLPEDRLEIAGPLDPPAPVLPCNERERRDLSQTIGSRPVWLAADLPMAELPAILAAHRVATRSTHRLLLILAPRIPEEAPPMARALGEAGLRVALRAEGDEPTESTQVYLADGTSEMGLWLRLAPVAYLGGTLPGGPGGRHPFEAAALGLALLHGPVTAPHGDAWARLDTAGAARVVVDAAELGRGVEALLAPDRAAVMAQAGWDVATQGAEVMNRVMDLVLERIHPADPMRDAGGAAFGTPVEA
ncbi:3-deoxy-D-manno-octulosonic-acid transferase [Rubellimicrobium mesophilum DSM 19309]|uniref:3-deoxy-D-manno-octulosonic acid transferase n=1 Tax=Rubellimicrobium mesophilum DSM 19309 TaxID=442562 RepID=A0A017HLM8_9RHOB|nr:glycosyltransferase N-terminal domain-containing protein [Rubellimicrobium mesophilum]EYD74679.1 3-deoxy-D-manno-octulosonic-acid transferase [Rubellimicrobium mesophilum DSM 19309]